MQHPPFVIQHFHRELRIPVGGLHVTTLKRQHTPVRIIKFMVGVVGCMYFHQEQLEECGTLLLRQASQNGIAPPEKILQDHQPAPGFITISGL
ncbi:hypothetical protein D3C75_684150 [compost metagenome]